MDVDQIQSNLWIFLSNAMCALGLNVIVFLVIGRTGAVTTRVAGVLKDWILIALSTLIFPESVITGLNAAGYTIGRGDESGKPYVDLPLFFLESRTESAIVQLSAGSSCITT